MFDCEDPGVDQPRLDAGEVRVTGPIPGAKTRRPADATPSAAFEAAVLGELGVSYAGLERHGKRLPGSRRPCLLDVEGLELRLEDAPAEDGLGPGLPLRFTLPAGSFATQFLREVQGGTENAS